MDGREVDEQDTFDDRFQGAVPRKRFLDDPLNHVILSSETLY